MKCVVFMVDLGQVAHQRLRAGIPEFWQGALEFDKLRRAEWVYGPDWKSRLAEKQKQAKQRDRATRAQPQTAQATPSKPEFTTPTLFDHPSDLDAQQ